jgi:hypothetical protein
MRIEYTPLSSGFMLVSILGALFGALWVMPISTNWGFIIVLVSIIMLIASVISMSKAPDQGQLDIYPKKR